MTIATLLFLVKEDEILLAMKKRGFGKGKWNGVGGKVEKGEQLEDAVVRECQEEIGVTPKTFEKVAIHHFKIEEMDPIDCHTYLSRSWEGEPQETEEMAPKWFKFQDIPYNEMWSDDQLWLPPVLNGKKLLTTFVFDTREIMTSAELTQVKEIA
jgi:8-oxo-dGTP diphosphatase